MLMQTGCSARIICVEFVWPQLFVALFYPLCEKGYWREFTYLQSLITWMILRGIYLAPRFATLFDGQCVTSVARTFYFSITLVSALALNVVPLRMTNWYAIFIKCKVSTIFKDPFSWMYFAFKIARFVTISSDLEFFTRKITNCICARNMNLSHGMCSLICVIFLYMNKNHEKTELKIGMRF